MDIIIRDYTNDDFDVVKNILLECFPDVSEVLEKTMDNYNTLSLDKNKYIQLVAVEGNKVVGYALASRGLDPILVKHNIFIDYVCVTSETKESGIAKKLIQSIEELAIEEKVLYLQLTSSRLRENSKKLYLDLGFEIRETDIYRKVLEW